jgi:signal transduction histidine kinase/HAMP domain-containing protein
MQGLRGRLLILFLSATVAVLGVSLHSTLRVQRAAEEQAQQSAMHLARALSVSQEHLFEQTYQLLISISQLPPVASRDSAACRKAMGGLMEPLFANLGVIGATGELICSSVSLSSTNVADQELFQRARETVDFVSGDFDPDFKTGKPLLNLAHPIVDAIGKPRAVAFASVDLAWLYQLGASEVPANATFSLLDDHGSVLVGNPSAEKAILAQRSRVQELLIRPTGGVLELSDGSGRGRVFAVTPIRTSLKGQKLFVGLEMAQPSAYVSKQDWMENLVGPIIIVLLITAVAWLGGDFFVVRGFHSLVKATTSLASGNLAARSQLPHAQGELGQLARAFDHLADSLQRRENDVKGAMEEMRSHRERQDALHEISLAITSTLDLAAILSALLEKLDLLLPYSAATVQLYDRESGRLEPIASRNVDEKEWKKIQREIPWKTGLGLPNVVFESKAPLVVANAQTDPRTMDPVFFRTHGFVSYLGVPLSAKGEILGVLSFYTKNEHPFSGPEIDFLTVLAGQAAIAIHNSQLFLQIKNQAVELEKSNKIKNEFLAVMSHELRTPLNIIMNYSDMVKGGMLGDVCEKQDRALGKVSQQSRQLLKMINEILEVTKLEAGTIKVEAREVSVADVLFSLKSEYGGSVEKEIDLIWSFPTEIPTLHSDGVKLKQILNHLIDNAIKFTDQGTVSVAARAVHERTVEFSVTDTGIGISEDSIPLIFEKFRQIDSSNTRSYGGIGLGLYLARTYTRMLGGTMEVQSRLGEGATFTVRIPSQEN